MKKRKEKRKEKRKKKEMIVIMEKIIYPHPLTPIYPLTSFPRRAVQELSMTPLKPLNVMLDSV